MCKHDGLFHAFYLKGFNNENITAQQGNYNIKYRVTKEKPSAFALEKEKVLAIEDLKVLGVYTFLIMLHAQEEYVIEDCVDKIKSHFSIGEKEIFKILKIIIEDLQLIEIGNED